MLPLFLYSKGQEETFFEDQELGRGEVGRVYTLLDKNRNATDLVCKEVHIRKGTGPILKDFLTPAERLYFTVNELKNLKKLGLLLGYKRIEDTFYIVMKKIEGVPASRSMHPEKSWHMFCALRKLHRKGIVHLDCHQGNFMINTTSSASLEVQAIDFNLSEEATYITTVLDNLIFFQRNHIHSFNMAIGFYVAEMKKYAFENKVKVCQDLLIKGAILLSAIYGIPVLAITHMMVREFISAMLIKQLGKELTAKGIEYFVSYLLQNRITNKRMLANMVHVFSLIKSCLSIYLMYSQLIYHFDKSDISRLFSLNKDNFLNNLLSNITPDQILHTALMYFPIVELLHKIDKVIEEYVLPEYLVKKKSDLLFSYSTKEKPSPDNNIKKEKKDNSMKHALRPQA